MVDKHHDHGGRGHRGAGIHVRRRSLSSIELPKFKITFNWGKLEGALSQLGLSLPFSPELSDLRGMFKEENSGGKSRRRTFLNPEKGCAHGGG
jgi:hypothetical protein